MKLQLQVDRKKLLVHLRRVRSTLTDLRTPQVPDYPRKLLVGVEVVVVVVDVGEVGRVVVEGEERWIVVVVVVQGLFYFCVPYFSK